MSDFFCETPGMNEVLKTVKKVAPVFCPVLIKGESGTGKESIAMMIHQKSERAKGPLVAVNCAALPSELVESELFGHEKGAFAGADERRIGRVEKANEGTLILEEIDALDSNSQIKLLRFLQEKTFEKVGSSVALYCDVKVLATSSSDLTRLVSSGKFREDLYYRLAVVILFIPPLRKRIEDVPILAEFFLKEVSAKSKAPSPGFKPEAISAMMNYQWPGNVRELENRVRRAFIFADSNPIGVDDLDFSAADVAKKEPIKVIQKLSDIEVLFGKPSEKTSVPDAPRWNMDDSAS